MIKLALVVPALALGGGVPAVARFIKDAALRDGRFDVRLISLSSSATDTESIRALSAASWMRGVTTSTGVWQGLPFVHVGVVGGEFEFQRYRPRKILTDTLADCDLIQIVCGSPAWANSVVGLGKPVALQVATRACVERRMRDTRKKRFVGWWRKAMTRVTDRMDDNALRRVDAIQVENFWMLDYARKLNGGRNVDLRYAPPGVDSMLFQPSLEQQPAQSPYVLCVARLSDPRKRIDLLLEAYARLPELLRYDVRLILAGSSGPPEHFWHRAHELGLRERITFIERPTTEALVRLYQGASVVALPSDEEGFGVVVIEAMACGVPVVSTRSGGPDGIIEDGVDGYLVPLNDAAFMSSRLQQLLQDAALNRRMGYKARQTINRRYDERVAGQVYVNMWERMAQKAGIA